MVTSGMTTGVVTLDTSNAFSGSDPATFQNPVSLAPAAGGAEGNYRFGTVGFGRSYNIVGVREAYLKVQFPMLGATLGRGPYKLGHGLVLDDVADAIAVNLMAGPANLTIANLKLFDTNSTGAVGGTGGDADLYLVNAGMKHGDEHMLNAFIAYLKDRSPVLLFNGAPSGGTNTTLWVLGVGFEGKLAALRLNLEADLLGGSREGAGAAGADADMAGMNIMANVGLMAGPLDIGVMAIYATGQDPTDTDTNVNSISGNFVLGNILANTETTSDREGGSPNPFGAGLMALKVSAGAKDLIGKDCHLELALIYAMLTEDPGVSPAPSFDETTLGTEVDLNMHHKLDDNLMLNVGLGYFMPGDGFKGLTGTTTAEDSVVKAGAGLSYSF
jgi:hypothetical protein